MKIIKTLNVHEQDLERAEKELIMLRDRFEMGSPVGQMLNDALTKVKQAARINRVDPQQFQNGYVYIVSSSLPLMDSPVANEIKMEFAETPMRHYKTDYPPPVRTL